MDLQLSGKTAVVTGSTAGIGFATAKRLAGEGAHVVINGRTRERVDAAVRAIREEAGITVNSVLPGPTASEDVSTFVSKLAKQRGITIAEMEKEFFATQRPSSLLKRFIKPDEVANLIAYVASPLSSATNGAALRVDGGVVRAVV